MRVSQNSGYHFKGPYYKDHSMLMSFLGSPSFLGSYQSNNQAKSASRLWVLQQSAESPAGNSKDAVTRDYSAKRRNTNV